MGASPFASRALPGVTTRRVRVTSTLLRESNVGANTASKAGSPAPQPPHGDSAPSQHQEQHDDGSGIEKCAHLVPRFVVASALADRDPPADVLNLSKAVETQGKASPRRPSQTASNQEEHPSLVPMRNAIVLQQLMNDSGMNAGSSFMAGFALGAQQAHTKALEQVQTSGALKMSLLAAHHELRRVQNRIRKIELDNAYSTGHVTFSLKSLDHRLAAAERSSTLQDRSLDRALMRLDSLEARTLFGTITRLLQRLGAVAWSWRRVPASIPLTYEQLMLVILSTSWLMGRITSPNSGLHGLLRNIRYWSWLICFALAQRRARRVLSRRLLRLPSS